MDQDADKGLRDRLHVAFFRALNLGHPRCPTREQLEGAFADAGAALARSVQTNGTVVFAPGSASVGDLVEEVSTRLAVACEFSQPALVRPASWVGAVLDSFTDHDVPDDFRPCVTLHDAAAPPPVELPWTSSTGDLVLVSATADHTLSVVRPAGGAGADPNSTLERLLGVPATTRVTTTLARVRRVLGEVAC